MGKRLYVCDIEVTPVLKRITPWAENELDAGVEAKKMFSRNFEPQKDLKVDCSLSRRITHER